MLIPVTTLIKRIALRQWLAITLLMLLAAGGMGYLNGLGRLDRTLYDQFMRANSRPARDDIIIVAIDDYSISKLGRWPWDRKLHAKLLTQVMRAHPLAIGLDVIMPEPQSTGTGGHDDRELAQALAASRLTVLPMVVANTDSGLKALLPTPDLHQSARNIGHISLEQDVDGVVRSVFLKEGQNATWWPHFAVALAEVAEHQIGSRDAALPGARMQLAPADSNAAQTGNWQRDYQVGIPYAGGSGHFRSVPYASVLEGEVPAQFFSGKYVLIGATAIGMADAFPTPVSGTSGVMPGIEINANILAGLLDHKTIAIAPAPYTALFSMLPVLLALIAYLLWAPRISLLITAALMALTMVASYFLLTLGIWVAPTAALIALAIAPPLWSWIRLESAISYLGQEFVRLDQEPHLLPEPNTNRTAQGAGDLLEQRINAMQAAVRRVRDLRQFISDSLHSLPDATLVTTTDGRVLVANQFARDYFAAIGIGRVDGAMLPDLLAGMSLPPASKPAAGHTFSWSDLIDLQHASAFANGVPVQDRQGRDLLIKSGPCHSARQALTGWIVSIVDITSIRAAERSRDQTLRFLSHDMRAPQASILALLELQTDPASALPQKEFFSRLEQAARKTLGLADNFVQLARAESAEYRLEEVDFQDVLHDAVDAMWTLAHNKKIALTTEIDGHEFLANVDRSLMARALCNLISNAINYSPAETRIRCSLRLEYAGLLPQLVCSIADQGFGIAAQDQDRLFQRFQRVSAPGQPYSDGTGLGLVFVKTVVERHFGEITLASTVGQGTTFSVTLPTIAI
ncbi:CHASE2 domain-containing protein [Paraherbaspirillum soli]|uniref:histidine kinase n=1 Tax=Paraherbaspirillum soli TaxID=631222 RepID=A0ABW0MHM3_9BURK